MKLTPCCILTLCKRRIHLFSANLDSRPAGTPKVGHSLQRVHDVWKDSLESFLYSCASVLKVFISNDCSFRGVPHLPVTWDTGLSEDQWPPSCYFHGKPGYVIESLFLCALVLQRIAHKNSCMVWMGKAVATRQRDPNCLG